MSHKVLSGFAFSLLTTSCSLVHSALTLGWVSLLTKILLYTSTSLSLLALSKAASLSSRELTTTNMGRRFSGLPIRFADFTLQVIPAASHTFLTLALSSVAPSKASAPSGTPSITRLHSRSFLSSCSKNNCCFVII